MSRRIFQFALFAVAVAFTFAIWPKGPSGPNGQKALSELRLRLQWTPQAQFAGYLVADKLGYYRQEGLSVKILPAGPDIKPQNTVASGSDHVGIGVANQIVSARAEGVPLRIIAQIFRDSANIYVVKSENRIASLAEIRGKNVGLWLGGDEAEFIAMLGSVGLKLSDVKVIPQEFSGLPAVSSG